MIGQFSNATILEFRVSSGERMQYLNCILEDDSILLKLVVAHVAFLEKGEMKKRTFILVSIALGLLCAMFVGIQAAKADGAYDLNDDGTVDINDIAYVAVAFGSRLDGPRWNSLSDLDGNGIVNVKDICLVAIHFGETTV